MGCVHISPLMQCCSVGKSFAPNLSDSFFSLGYAGDTLPRHKVESRGPSGARSLCLVSCRGEPRHLHRVEQSPFATPALAVGVIADHLGETAPCLTQTCSKPPCSRAVPGNLGCGERRGQRERAEVQTEASLSHTSRTKLGRETRPPPAAEGSGGEDGSAGEKGRPGATTQVCCLHMLFCKIWVKKGACPKLEDGISL